ncbi:MAG TPA: RIP metalloprotease RseP, partial [Clostridiales bacterium]|nr:RIP metalloprotease RseP [Clostridiales bacterium]
MTTILIALLFFSIIIMIHELGHFLAAKAAGIYAEEFSIGMGPRLLKISGKETVYSLRLLPIGGYVRFLGEDEDSSE